MSVLQEVITAYSSRAPRFNTGFLVGPVLLNFLVSCVVLSIFVLFVLVLTCVPYAASVSGFFILDCTFSFL